MISKELLIIDFLFRITINGTFGAYYRHRFTWCKSNQVHAYITNFVCFIFLPSCNYSLLIYAYLKSSGNCIYMHNISQLSLSPSPPILFSPLFFYLLPSLLSTTPNPKKPQQIHCRFLNTPPNTQPYISLRLPAEPDTALSLTRPSATDHLLPIVLEFVTRFSKHVKNVFNIPQIKR